jgi:hypothetical protein
MTAIILYAEKKQRLVSPQYTMLLLVAVLLNVGVWAVEKAVDVEFEFLSVSYVATEVILLLLYGMLRDYGIIQPGGSIRDEESIKAANEAGIAMVFTGKRHFKH